MAAREETTLNAWLATRRAGRPWWDGWFCDGIVVCAAEGRVFEVKSLDVPLPVGLEAVGCGGWRADGGVEWVGLDLDVGHGSARCESLECALADARRVLDFVDGAAEVRQSRGGVGLHVRVRLADGVCGGRVVAPRIAKWLVKELRLMADGSPLGRQNFWFWTAKPVEESFLLVEPCIGVWRPPARALVEYPSPTVSGGGCGCAGLSRRTREFLAHGVLAGERNFRLFCAAADMCGCGMTEDEAVRRLAPVALGCGLCEREARRTIRSAFAKPRFPARTDARTK